MLVYTDAQELHARFYHALGCVAVARHDAVGQRAVVHADADGRVVLLTDVQEGDKAVAYLLQLLRIFLVGILQVLEGTGSVYVVTGVDAYLLGIESGHVGHARIEVYIGHQRRHIAVAAQGSIDVAKVFGFLHALCREPHVFTARIGYTFGLSYAGIGILGSGIGHALYADRIVASQRSGTDIDYRCFPAGIVE